MGQEIGHEHFSADDFARFQAALEAETGLLAQWFDDGALARRGSVAGFEVEAWLVDRDWLPAPINEAFLARLDDPLVSPELSRFNIELNCTPAVVGGDFLSRMSDELHANWHRCEQVAEDEFDARLMMIGILPSLRDEHLTLANMSAMRRYQALNEQVMRLREGRPLRLDINGHEHLVSVHHDVMLEAATTSFQLHLQVDPESAVRFYNASIVVSAATVGVAVNSPWLFGRDLWDETRIPLFEQAVDVGGIAGAARGPLHRVSFGSGYARDSLFECFRENLEHFPVLLPARLDQARENLPHLRLHNGTIWRWNRPLIGFEEDGTPHLRIEHRVVASGPTIDDMIANATFYYGLVHALAAMDEAPESRLPFHLARDNFYAAARRGPAATVTWLDGRRGRFDALVLDELLPLARAGLERMDVDEADVRHYLGIVQARIAGGQTGAAWQRAWVERHGRDMQALTAACHEHQLTEKPVHEW